MTVPGRPVDQVSVDYDPGRLMVRVQNRRRHMRSRGLSLVISIIVLTVIGIWRRDVIGNPGFTAIYVIILSASALWFLIFLIGYLQAKKELDGIGHGTAVRLDRVGVAVAGLTLGWGEVATLGSAKAGLGRGPVLQVTAADGRSAAVPFEQLDIPPATLDSAARAYSSGRFGVDLTALDS